VGRFPVRQFYQERPDSRYRIFKQEKRLGSRPFPSLVHIARQRRSFQGIPGFQGQFAQWGQITKAGRKMGSVHGKNPAYQQISWGHPGGKEVGPISKPKSKYKFALYLHPETYEQVSQWYRRVDCRSKTEFCEKAIQFYVSHLQAEDGGSYLLNVIAATHKIDRGTLERLRGECVKEVKRTNGNFTLDDAVDWQEGNE